MRKPIIKKSELWDAIRLYCFQCSGESYRRRASCEMTTGWKGQKGQNARNRPSEPRRAKKNFGV